MGPSARNETRRIRWLRIRLAGLRKALPAGLRLKEGVEHGVMATIAAFAAYVPTQMIGLREGFWAAITAIAVVQSEYDATRTSARDQFVGAAIGGVIGVAVVMTTGQHMASYALAVMLSIVAASVLNVASAARLAGITATIILLVPHVGSAEDMMVSRILEVGWGVSVAIVLVWLAERVLRKQEPAA